MSLREVNTAIDTLRPKAAAKALGISVATILRLRQRGEFVPAIRLDKRSLGFRIEDLRQWQAQRETR